VSAANRNDISELLDLVDAFPAIGGRPGRPCRRPQAVQGDRGYDSDRHRLELRVRGIRPILARRYRGHGSGLGRTRWVVERTLAWLHRFRRLTVRYERRACVHEAFLTLACALVCWYFVRPAC
jgi:transposase